MGSHLVPAAWHRDLRLKGTGPQIHPPVSTESEAKDESRHRRLLCLGDGVLVFWGVTPRWYGQCWDEPGGKFRRGEARVQWAESDGGQETWGVDSIHPFPELGRKGRAGREQQLRLGIGILMCTFSYTGLAQKFVWVFPYICGKTRIKLLASQYSPPPNNKIVF